MVLGFEDLSHQDKISKGFGLVTWLFFFITGSSVMFFVLSAEGSIEFRRVMTFVTAFSLPLLLMLLLSRIEFIGNRLRSDDEGEPLFFMKNPTMKDLIMIPPAIGVLFLVSIVLHNAGNDFAVLMFAGILLGGLLMITRAIIIPIVVHGTYNSIIYLDSKGLLGNTGLPSDLPINVPLINAQIELFGEVTPEIVFQYALTATGEEMLRAFFIGGFLLASSGDFETKKLNFIAGILVSGTAWAVMHAIQGGIRII
ncbi:MAG: hypothetical protein K5790_10185 [Nitrosopumilus sp.]|uniref:hypothetical protein n=1 Tax=Nitrosopumilus sp. TaxID=2024843 RepID=UPI00247D4D87|nr:hypothetical protein [Nitrosopumilus sp.]MCV0393637.1 hypothetical protein [Nitrosopumilus sp.]